MYVSHCNKTQHCLLPPVFVGRTVTQEDPGDNQVTLEEIAQMVGRNPWNRSSFFVVVLFPVAAGRSTTFPRPAFRLWRSARRSRLRTTLPWR